MTQPSPPPSPPVISVIIPLTENASLLTQTLNSLNRSACTRITIHLCHGSFTPSQAQAITKLSINPIHFHANQNKDAVQELADCADAASGDYLHFLLPGDHIDPEFYSVLLAALHASPELSFVCGDNVSTASPATNQRKFERDTFSDLYSYRLTSLLSQPMTLSTALIPKNLYSQIGGIQPRANIPWAYDLCLRLGHATLIQRHPSATITPSMEAQESVSANSALDFVKTRGVPFFIPHSIQANEEGCINYAIQLTHLLINKGHLETAHLFLLWLSTTYPESGDAKAQSAPLFARVGDLDTTRECVIHWQKLRPEDREANACLHDLFPPSHRGKSAGQRMSVLFVCHSFPPSPYAFGGTELYALYMARALIQRGIHVAVMTPLYESLVMQPGTIRKTRYEGVDLLQVRLNHFKSLSNTLWNPELGEQLVACIEEHHFDLVHVQYPLGIGLITAEALTRRNQIPTLITLHDASLFCDQGHLREAGKPGICSGPETPKKCAHCHLTGSRRSVEAATAPEQLERIFKLRDKTVKLLIERLQRVLVPTEFLYRYLERFNYPLTNVTRTTLGTNLFEALPHTPGQVVRFIYLGNIVSVKGVGVLLEAFQSIGPTEAELHLHGRSFAGSLLDALKPYLEQPNVFYHGAYDHKDLPVILQRADVGVLPSYSENYPTVAREFLHAGIPIIASRVGGVPEIVKDNVNGLLFESGDVQELHRHLRAAIEHPERFDDFKKKIDPIYSLDDDATHTLELYDSLLQGSPPQEALVL